VLERALGAVAREIAARRDEVPVRDVEERRRDVTAEVIAEDGRRRERPPGHHHDHQREQPRDQTPQAARPEAGQVDPAVDDLTEQQRRDQVAAQHEEQIDAQESAGSVRQTEVERHHRSDGNQTQPVECVVPTSASCRSHDQPPSRMRPGRYERDMR